MPATPPATPRRRGEAETSTIPESAILMPGLTSVRRPAGGSLDTSKVDLSGFGHSAAPGVTTTSMKAMDDSHFVMAAADLHHPTHHAVVPLPTRLDMTSTVSMRSATPTRSSTMTAPSSATRFHKQHTFSSHTRQAGSPARGRVRPSQHSSRSSSALGRAPPPSFRTSSSSLSGIHAPDASCCGYLRAEEHKSHAATKGLFVTFCEDSLLKKATEAERNLDAEIQARSSDEQHHRMQLARLSRDVQRSNSELEQLHAQHSSLVETYKKAGEDHKLVRDEWERRFQESEAQRAAEAAELGELREFKRRAQLEATSRAVEMEALNRQLQDSNAALTRAEKATLEQARATHETVERLSISQKSVSTLEHETKTLRDTLSAREALILGLQTELRAAHEKLSSVSVLRSLYRGAADTTKSRS